MTYIIQLVRTSSCLWVCKITEFQQKPSRYMTLIVTVDYALGHISTGC